MATPISERKKHILRAVVVNYIKTAEPVGSRTVARSHRMNLSSATIRNEMADLEEMGYLSQPHTSAGRIPSQTGYRYYVDNLMDLDNLSEDDESALSHSLSTEKMREIEQIIVRSAKILSSVTNQTSMIMGPQFRKSAFHQLRILPLDDRKGLVVLITDAGFIKNKVIDLHPSLSPIELHQVVSYLNHKLYGLTIDQVTTSLINELKRDLFRRMEILEQAFILLEESLKEEKQIRVFLFGTTNILNQPEFKDVSKIRRMLNLFEQETLLFKILEDSSSEEGITVTIGAENAVEDIQECALITGTYKIHDKTLGTLGVLGPIRLDYSRVISVMQRLVDNLNKSLSS
ncbi:MAG TPA: heat-inducible transcriptional repressor HrcA [Candidatus Limnocylindrales bacterium]|nr:heat-inducible transcriptional repressor HrcA [Candidatus Limnocylindrales bacterium]